MTVMYAPMLPIITCCKLPNTCFSTLFWLFKLVNITCMDPLSLPVILSLVLIEKNFAKIIEKVGFI